MKVILTGILVFAVYSVFTIRYYLCEIMEFCGELSPNVEEVVSVPEVIDSAPEIDERDLGNLVFDWENTNPITNNDFNLVKDSLSTFMSDESKGLVITGTYFSQEINNTNFENLGLARASAVKDLLQTEEYGERISIASNLSGGDPEKIEFPFKGIDLDYIILEKLANDFAVTNLANKIIINFPVASADPGLNKGLNKALDDLAETVITSGAEIIVTGHTDNTGSKEANHQYGMERAEAIQKMLIDKNVSPSRIKIDSKGEAEPISENTTEEGKKKNRRVEIVVSQ